MLLFRNQHYNDPSFGLLDNYHPPALAAKAYNCRIGFYRELVSNEPPKRELETLIFVCFPNPNPNPNLVITIKL